MEALLLGISIGLFMYAFVNKTWNTQKWIQSKYIFWLGIFFLAVSLVLFWR